MLRFERAGETQFKIVDNENNIIKTVKYESVRSDMRFKESWKQRLLTGQFLSRIGNENVESIANIVAEWALNNCLLLLQENCKDIKADASKGSALFWGLVLTSLYWANADTITNYSVLNENYALFWDLCCQQIRWRSNRTFPFLDREKSRIWNAMFFIPYAPYFENENITKEILGKVYQQIPQDYDECFLSGMTIHAGKFENSTYMVFSDLPDAEKSDYLRQTEAFSIYDFDNVANDFHGMSENIPTKQILYDDLMRQRTERKTSLHSLWQQHFQQNQQPSAPPPPPRLPPEPSPPIQYELVNRLVQEGLNKYHQTQSLPTLPVQQQLHQARELAAQSVQSSMNNSLQQEQQSQKLPSQPANESTPSRVLQALKKTKNYLVDKVYDVKDYLLGTEEEKQEKEFWDDLKTTGGRNQGIPQEFHLAIRTLLNLNPPSSNIKSIRALQREAASAAANTANTTRQKFTEQAQAQAQALAQQMQLQQQQQQQNHQLDLIQQLCGRIGNQIQDIRHNLSKVSTIEVSPSTWTTQK